MQILRRFEKNRRPARKTKRMRGKLKRNKSALLLGQLSLPVDLLIYHKGFQHPIALLVFVRSYLTSIIDPFKSPPGTPLLEEQGNSQMKYLIGCPHSPYRQSNQKYRPRKSIRRLQLTQIPDSDIPPGRYQ